METDKHFFLEGLFILAFVLAGAFLFAWLAHTGSRDDIEYRIHFAESVSGLSQGDSVKFNGVDVGTVKSLRIDQDDTRLVQVDVRLRKDAPIKTDTRAVLALKGITGVVFVELEGGTAAAQRLVDATPAGQVPEIPSQKSTLTQVLEDLPRVIKKFSGIEDKVSKVATDVGDLTGKLHDKFGPYKKDKDQKDPKEQKNNAVRAHE